MQQINLYQDILKKPREWLTHQQLGYALGGVLLVLVLISFGQAWRNNALQDELQVLQAEERQIMARLEEVTRQLSEVSNTGAITGTISQKEAELKDKQYVLQALTGRQFGNTIGFAEQFSGLARQAIDGVWLTGLHIHAGGARMNLSGSTYDAQMVPRYLQRLSKEPSFNGLEFQTFQMQRVENNRRIDFDLRSTPKEPG